MPDDAMTAAERVAAKFPTVTAGLFESDYALLVGDVVEIAEAHAAAAVARITEERDGFRNRLSRAIHDGYLRTCDIPACNCGGYHSELTARLHEEIDARDEARAENARLRELLSKVRHQHIPSCKSRNFNPTPCDCPAGIANDKIDAALGEKGAAQ